MTVHPARVHLSRTDQICYLKGQETVDGKLISNPECLFTYERRWG